jgi:phosphoribosylglycinamide formyltransferase 1
MSFRVAVLVSGEGTNLQAIIDSLHQASGIEIVCVGSNKADAKGLQRAKHAGIATEVFPRANYSDRQHRDAALGDWLEAHDTDLVVLAGYMELLDATFVRRFAGSVINVHPSLLPAFAGVGAIEKALSYGVRVTGVTVHFVDEGVDSGPIIMQEALNVSDRDRDAITESIQAIEHRLLPDTISLIARGHVHIDPDNPRRVLVDRAR